MFLSERVQTDAFNSTELVVRDLCIHNIGESDFNEMEESVTIHRAAMHNFNDTLVFEERSNERARVKGSHIEYIDDVVDKDGDEAEAALTRQIHTLAVNIDSSVRGLKIFCGKGLFIVDDDDLVVVYGLGGGGRHVG